MDRDQIKQTIDDFLLLIEKGYGSTEQNEENLKVLLDKLAMAQHFVTGERQKKIDVDSPQRTNMEWRNLVTVRFPNYGHYNVAESVTQKIAESFLNVGDAIDDMADIAGDLSETAWRWRNNGFEDGLWHFKNSFQTHWAEHLRGLQIYLLNLERNT